MVRYSDIQGVLKEFETNGRKHLFRFNETKVEFWARRDGLWRIITDLSLEDAEVVARSLNDTLSEGEQRFFVQNAWEDLERPYFALPKLTSQIIGRISDIDTVDRIYIAIAGFRDLSHITPSLLRKNIPQQRVDLNTNMPQGHSIENILDRLSQLTETEEIIPPKKTRTIIRTPADTVSDEEIDEYIRKLRDEGKTYKEMMELASNKFGTNITEYRIRKTIANSQSSEQEVEEERDVKSEYTDQDIDDLIINLRQQGKTYADMKEESAQKFGEEVSEYRIKKVLREKGLIGR